MAFVRADVTRVAVTFVAFEAAWFACVLSAARGNALIGVGAAAAAVALHFALSGERLTDVMLLGAALGIGLLWDTALGRFDLVEYASPGPLPGWAPSWILALWALFATLLRGPLRWLQHRPLLAALLGGIGGALSYAGAARLGACRFPNFLRAMPVLVIGWGLITPLLIELARRLEAGRLAHESAPR